MTSLTTEALPLLPLDAGVILPGMTVTLALETAEAKAAADAAKGAGGQLVLVPRLGRSDGPDAGPGRYSRVGTVASIERAGELPGGTPALIVRGRSRATVGSAIAAGGPALWVRLDPVSEPAASEVGRASVAELKALIQALAEHRGILGVGEMLREMDDPGRLADTAGYWSELSVERKVRLLETAEPDQRIALVLAWGREILAELELKDRIRNDVAEGMEKTQREYLLRQQLAAIRKELGEAGEVGDDDDYRSRLETLEVDEGVRSVISKEIDRLERTSDSSPELGWIRTWLDTVFDLPWGKRSPEALDMVAAREILDADHTGLEEVKARLIEHLAVRKLRHERGMSDHPTSSGPPRRHGAGMILALVGPPGVGKTSLGESVARAMGRSFVRIALGGVRDEAELRGHRRTYVGAMPGRIARALREAGTMNPVILLDEVDKLGNDWRGDPASALLEVLDPAQNHTFKDHYLDIELDLSDVLFIATANDAAGVPPALLDRMEVVHIEGYTLEEKVAIARDHLVPRERDRAGLLEAEMTLTEEALAGIVAAYTKEAGVRSLERQVAKVLRKAAAHFAGAPFGAAPLVVDRPDLSEWLGRPRFSPEVAERTASVGVATGLAVTGAGGEVLFVEASASEGEPALVVTGQLGEVMQESVQIAMSYARAHREELGIPAGAFEGRRFHLHVPAGAIPKDGPSAGVTMTTALVSLLSGRPVRAEVGMTGEVTLQGKVLPIGGLKAKVLAAHQAGVREVVLPARNQPDLDDVAQSVRSQMKFHFASDVKEVLDVALAGEAELG